MKSKTLSTIGLPVRLEVLIKSHLQLVNARTIDRWSFSDDASTDVAICDPDSTFTTLALKRSRETGSPVCIQLVDARRHLPQGTISLHEPLHVADIIELLDQVSNGLTNRIRESESVAAGERIEPAVDYAEHFARRLHEIMDSASRDLHLIEAGSLRFCLLPVSRSIFLAEVMSDAWLERTLRVDAETVVTPIPIAQQQELLSHFPNRASLIKLLWYAGLQAPATTRYTRVAANSLFSIRRWPDFGSLKHKPVHLRMAAELSRARMTMDQLANATKASIEQVRSFIDACALCNLLNTSPPETSTSSNAPSEARHSRMAVVATPRRGTGFLHSIRMALGMRAI